MGAGSTTDLGLLSLAVTSVPQWEPDGTESPAERTDPLLPAITDGMPPPAGLPRLPTLDDRTLAQMLAELDGDEESESTAATAAPAPPAQPRADVETSPARDTSLRLVEHPAASEAREPHDRETSAGVWPTRNAAKYVRRDLRPPEVHADALTLTGLTRRSRSRVGSIVFTVVFAGIFLLILVQTIVSLLTPGG